MSDPVTHCMVSERGSPAQIGAAGLRRVCVDGLLAGLVFAVLSAGMFVAGCGGKTPAVAPVTGVVTRAGQPLAGATVVFSTVEPVAGFGRLVATGKTGDDGRFTLVTRIDARRSAPGGPVGDNRVTISASMPPDGLTEPAYQAQLDAHQQKIQAQGYAAAGDGPRPRVSALKPEFSDSARTPLAAKVASGGANDFTFAVE